MLELLLATAALAPYAAHALASPRISLSACQRPALRPAFMTEVADEQGDVGALHAWLDSKGVSRGKVVAKRLPGFGLSIAAGEPVRAGDTLLSVPASLHLTPALVKASPVGQAVGEALEDESALLALGLLQEIARGPEASAYWPYLELLPSSEQMLVPCLWSEEERGRLLAGSHLAGAVNTLLDDLRQQWATLQADVIPSHPELFPADTYRWEGYLWAHAIVLTRALPFGDALSLIPYLDLANHAAGAQNTCSIAMCKSDGGVQPVTEAWQLTEMGGEAAAVITAGAPLEAGEQMFIDYGEAGWRSSWEMLYTYGFVPGDAQDWLAAGGRPLFFGGIAPDDPLAAQKKALLVALGADEDAANGMWVELKAASRSGGDMAPFLRLVHLAKGGTTKEDAVAAAHVETLASWSAVPVELWEALQRPLGPTVEAAVAATTLDACGEALRALPAADELKEMAAPHDGVQEPSVERERERLAARVLLGERCALEACIAFWQRATAA